MSKLGVVGICGLSIGVVAVDNISTGRDPFPSIMAGGIFMAGCVGISEIDEQLAAAVAWVFLLSNLLLKSDPLLKVISGATGSTTSKLNSTTNSVHASIYKTVPHSSTTAKA